VVSPLVATPIASPNPVFGADDKVHLAYRHRPLFTGGSVTIDRQALSGPHHDQIPLADQVVSFP